MISSIENKYKNFPTPQVTIGLRGNYEIRQNFQLHAGLAFSYLEAKRRNTVTSLFTTTPGNSIAELVTDESFKFYNLEIPIGISFLNKKWSLEVGITPSIILDSRFEEMKDAFDPAEITIEYPWESSSSIPRPSTNNKAKTYFSLSISPLYQLSSRLSLGVEYNHGLTKAYYTDDYASNYYQSMKLNTLGFKVLYAIDRGHTK